MADAYPVSDLQEEVHQDVSRKKISILLLAGQWQFDTYGLSTVNKSLVNNLRLVDPESKTIEITCAVLGKEGNDDQIGDANKYGVQLKGAKQPRGKKTEPELQWLDKYTGAYYHHLTKGKNYDFIIGHVPYLANGSFNLKELCHEIPKVILFIHGLPKTLEGEVDEDLVIDWLKDADVVFSVGKAVEDEVLPRIMVLDDDKKPIHKMYIPAYPLELFCAKQQVRGDKVQGTQNITMMTGERKDLDVNGLDFPLAVSSTSEASQHIRDLDGVRTNLVMLGANEEDRERWKKDFEEFVRHQEARRHGLTFQFDTPENSVKLATQMRKSNLFLFPLKPDSPLFGTEVLAAVAAGVPILVSRYCGMSHVLHNLIQNDSIVIATESQSDKEVWKEGITEKILRPEDSQQKADRLREQLLLDTRIAQTHLDFINTVAEEACIQLEMELDTDSVVPPEHVETAIKFGVEPGDSTDAKKYVVAFLSKLILQREKLNLGFLANRLKPEVARMWQEIVSIIENTNRKLLDVKRGSLIFLLFSPTNISARELHDESWRNNLTLKMERLLKLIGVEAKIRIQPPDIRAVAMEMDSLPMLRELKSRYTVESEARSEGYETMTRISSDSKSEVLTADRKVTAWLKQQPDSQTGEGTLTLLETIKAGHITGGLHHLNIMTLSESGSIAITNPYRKPSFSVIHPGTDKPLNILSGWYWSVLFIKTVDKEYLAGTCMSEGSVRLWDVENNYKLDKPKMTLCAIDKRTVACGDVYPSFEGICQIYILNTDTQMWSLGSILMVKGVKRIRDMCYLKTEDGTSCLLLCCAEYHIIQAVEMIGNRIKWKTDERQMHRPWSICTDDNNTVYVVDLLHKLHLLSGSDGTVITSVSLQQYGIFFPSWVRLRDDVMYILHRNIEKPDQDCVSKFTKPSEI